MCEDCRIIIQHERGQDPYAGPPRPVPRTTEDYLRERDAQALRDALRANSDPSGPERKLDS
jgi:hypothetical protein